MRRALAATKEEKISRSRISLLAGLFSSALLLVAVVVWATAAPAPAAQRGAPAAQDPPVTASVTPVRPVPPGSPAHPGVGAVIGARSTYPPGPPDILNHAAFNLSLGGEEGDCPGCPIPVLDVLGLNPANEGVLASYELNPSNARQQVSDNWEWYWPRVTNTVYLWASAPQELIEDKWRPVFTPGIIYIRAAAWHQDPWNDMHQPRPTFCVIPTVGPSVTPGGPAVFNVDRDREPTEGRIIAPPFPLYTPTPTPNPAHTPTNTPPPSPTVTPGGPRPTPTHPPNEWKYWACAGPLTDTTGLPTFEMYKKDDFTSWIGRNSLKGMQYIVGNEEEYYMLPEAYAAWYKLIYTTIVSDTDPTAELYISGLGVWHYTFGPSLGTVLPVIYKNVTSLPSAPTPTPTPKLPGQESPGGYPLPSPSPPPPSPTSGGYPPPGGGEAVAPPRPAAAVGSPGAPAGVLDSTPLPTLPPRAFGEAKDWARACWLPAVLRAYRYTYCPEDFVDDTGQPPPPPDTPYPAESYDRMPSAGFMAHLYAASSDQVIDSCDDAAWSYGQWAYRLDALSYYFQRWEDYVVNTDFYIQETGIINGAYIDYKEMDRWGSQPRYPESQTCNPNYGYPIPNPTDYQGCLAAVDLSNRLSWYIVTHGQELPGAKATGPRRKLPGLRSPRMFEQ